MKQIVEVAEEIGIGRDELELYGSFKAKVKLSVLERIKSKPQGRYIIVTAITPTPFGEGKTVTTIGLAMALSRIGKSAIATLRQPSLGPVFGIKGGATGGGLSQVMPLEEINLHFTGDTHAVGVAHNLLCAILDNSLWHSNKLDIDEKSILLNRVVDVSDRVLRNIIIRNSKFERESGFDITPASEVMAILALSISLRDMRERLGKIIVGETRNKKPVTAEDLKAAGAMAILLKDAIKPNLAQTTEGTPVFIHTGPFGNIAHGSSSCIADMIATCLAQYTVTESGFGADLGFEKFIDIKCRQSRLVPDAAVIVCTVRAMKIHSGKYEGVPRKSLLSELSKKDLDATISGCKNLVSMLKIVSLTKIPSIVAINRFEQDSDEEIDAIKKIAKDAGASGVEISEVYTKGSQGGVSLARAVISAIDKNLKTNGSRFNFIYPLSMSIKEKIETLAKKCYGAKDVMYSPLALEKIKLFTEWKLDKLPICMAKTQLSLSHDPKMKGSPEGFTFPIQDIRVSQGAGFIVPISGEIKLMPGLPENPRAAQMEIDEKGNIEGLS